MIIHLRWNHQHACFPTPVHQIWIGLVFTIRIIYLSHQVTSGKGTHCQSTKHVMLWSAALKACTDIYYNCTPFKWTTDKSKSWTAKQFTESFEVSLKDYKWKWSETKYDNILTKGNWKFRVVVLCDGEEGGGGGGEREM